MTTTTQGFQFGQWIVTTCGAVALGLTLGLGSVAAESIDYQPGDAAGHATADLKDANERQAAAVARTTTDRWTGDAAGFAAQDLEAANERQTAGIARSISPVRFIFVPGDAAGHAEADLRNANERQQAGLARTIDDGEIA